MTKNDPTPSIDETFDWNEVYSGEASDFEPPNEVILRTTEGLVPGRALDIGCGAGGLLVALAAKGWRVEGMDIADKAIAAARAVVAESGVDATLTTADARTWRPKGQFDLITNSFALPFGVGPRGEVFAMIREALAPGGTVIIEDFDSSMAESGFLAGTDLLTIEELLRAFEGFEVVRAEVIDTPVHNHGNGNGNGDGNGDGHANRRWTAAIFHARHPA